MKRPNLNQIRSAHTLVECNFSVSRTADILHTTQPSVSKMLKALDDDLGTPVFIRSGGRIVGLSEFGNEILGYVRCIMHYSAAVLERARERKKEPKDTIRIGTTHIYSRYALPRVIQSFMSHHPKARIYLEQGDPEQIAEWVSTGRVELGITAILGQMPSTIVGLPALSVERCIITPPGHELLSKSKPSLADLAEHPFVSYQDVFTSGAQVQQLFIESGLLPKTVIKATDASVIKAFVKAGLGVSVVQRIAIEPEDEGTIGVMDGSHLFPPAVAYLLFSKNRNLRASVHDFIEAFAPQWSRQALKEHFVSKRTVH